MQNIEQSFLYREIHQQPETLAKLLAAEKSTAAALATAIRAREISQVVIAARGTSDNAGRYAQYLLGAMNGMLVTLATPSLFSIYHHPPVFGNALVLGISQSGKSPDIVSVLAEAKKQGALTAAITNQPDSDLAQHADFTIALHAGAEKSVAATKTYTAELTAIAMLSTALAADGEMATALETLPQAVSETLALNPQVAQGVERYRYMQHCVVIGRGFNYATAFELALKLKELTYTIVEPYSSADFQHGPLAVIEPGFPVIVVAPVGVILPEMQSFVQTVKSRGAEVVVIGNDDAALAEAQLPLTISAVPEWLSPVVAILPGQLFAMHLAHTRHYPLDTPRGLQKVTETI